MEKRKEKNQTKNWFFNFVLVLLLFKAKNNTEEMLMSLFSTQTNSSCQKKEFEWVKKRDLKKNQRSPKIFADFH
jgi:hypothetical protein